MNERQSNKQENKVLEEENESPERKNEQLNRVLDKLDRVTGTLLEQQNESDVSAGLTKLEPKKMLNEEQSLKKKNESVVSAEKQEEPKKQQRKTLNGGQPLKKTTKVSSDKKQNEKTVEVKEEPEKQTVPTVNQTNNDAFDAFELRQATYDRYIEENRIYAKKRKPVSEKSKLFYKNIILTCLNMGVDGGFIEAVSMYAGAFLISTEFRNECKKALAVNLQQYVDKVADYTKKSVSPSVQQFINKIVMSGNNGRLFLTPESVALEKLSIIKETYDTLRTQNGQKYVTDVMVKYNKAIASLHNIAENDGISIKSVNEEMNRIVGESNFGYNDPNTQHKFNQYDMHDWFNETVMGVRQSMRDDKGVWDGTYVNEKGETYTQEFTLRTPMTKDTFNNMIRKCLKDVYKGCHSWNDYDNKKRWIDFAINATPDEWKEYETECNDRNIKTYRNLARLAFTDGIPYADIKDTMIESDLVTRAITLGNNVQWLNSEFSRVQKEEQFDYLMTEMMDTRNVNPPITFGGKTVDDYITSKICERPQPFQEWAKKLGINVQQPYNNSTNVQQPLTEDTNGWTYNDLGNNHPSGDIDFLNF